MAVHRGFDWHAVHRCDQCLHTYPYEAWREREPALREDGQGGAHIVRTAECPSCHSISDMDAAYDQGYLLRLIQRLLPGWGSDMAGCSDANYEAYTEACDLLGIDPEAEGREKRRAMGMPTPHGRRR